MNEQKATPSLPNQPPFHQLWQRRDLLRVGSLSLAATAVQVGPVTAATGNVKAKSVIYLWMRGGVTHIDSFDPKPDAPA